MKTTFSPPRVSPLFVGLDLVPSRGGPYKSLAYFQRALGGRVASFTSPDLWSEVSPGTFHVPARASFLGRVFRHAAAAEVARLDALLTDVDLLSLHILFRYSAHWVASRARRRGLPYWVVPHGCLDPYVFTYRAGIKRLWMALVGRRVLRDAALVIFSTRRELQKASPWFASGKGRVVFWPVEQVDEGGRAAARAAWRQRLGLKPDARMLLSLARLHAMKRPLETIRALERAGGDVHLIMAGPDDEFTSGQLLAQAAAGPAGTRIHVVGACYGAAKDELVLACDGFISLSARENFNHAAAEAIAAGLPVILSPGNDLGGDLAPERCGWLLDDDGEATVVAALREFSSASLAELHELGERGQRFAMEKLSFTAFQTALEALVAETMAMHRPRA